MSKAKYKITEHGMVARMHDMMLATWAECASDWASIGGSIKGDGVQECVADADRFDIAGDKEAAAQWRKLSREDQDIFLNRWFPKNKRFD